MPEADTVTDRPGDDDVLLFLATLGSALSAIGETVDSVETRLRTIALSYGMTDARFSAFPTFVLLTLGQGRAATIEPTTRLSATPRLDQIAAVHELATRAERAEVTPRAGIAQLDAIRRMDNRFGDVTSVVGYAVLTIGLALILHPAARDVAGAAVLGALVGVLRRLGRGRRTVEALMPFLAATCVATIVALAVEYDVTDPGLRAMIASLVVFLPGVALTTAFLELTEGQMVAGSSRLVWGATQLGLLAFGIVAGIGVVGVPAQQAFSSSDALLGSWAPWLGVLVFAVGVTIAHSAPPGTFPSLLIVLYAAWIGQFVGNELLGAYASGFVGALVMTFAAYLLAGRPNTMPVYAVFLPGFWLLVPGTLGLIGLTTVLAIPESATAEDVLAIVASIASVALGVLCGVEIHAWLDNARGHVHRVRRKGA